MLHSSVGETCISTDLTETHLQVLEVWERLAVCVSSRRLEVIELITETTDEACDGHHEARACHTQRYIHIHSEPTPVVTEYKNIPSF